MCAIRKARPVREQKVNFLLTLMIGFLSLPYRKMAALPLGRLYMGKRLNAT